MGAIRSLSEAVAFNRDFTELGEAEWTQRILAAIGDARIQKGEQCDQVSPHSSSIEVALDTGDKLAHAATRTCNLDDSLDTDLGTHPTAFLPGDLAPKMVVQMLMVGSPLLLSLAVILLSWF